MAENGWDQYGKLVLGKLGDLDDGLKGLGERIDKNQKETTTKLERYSEAIGFEIERNRVRTDKELSEHAVAIATTQTSVRNRAALWAAIVAAPPALIALIAFLWTMASK